MAKKPTPPQVTTLDVGDRVELTNGKWGKVVFDITTTPLIIQLEDGGGLMRVAGADIAQVEKAKEPVDG